MAEVNSDPFGFGLLTPLVGIVVALVTALAWYVTWATSGLVSALMMVPFTLTLSALLVFFGIIVAMMAAMMLPSALPMILTFHGLSKRQEGSSGGKWRQTGTIIFTSAYFLLWGTFGVVSLLGLTSFTSMGKLGGLSLLIPGVVLIGAGAYQLVQPKKACLRYCQNPFSFVMRFWRTGRFGAFRMGLRHASYCVGCCWLFMIVLFVTGAMSLLWMGAISVVIFLEKIGPKRHLISRVLGVLFLVAGGLVAAQPFIH